MVAGVSLESVLARIGEACGRADRASDSVTLVAVTKGRSVQEILALYEAGHRDFGENRAQELDAKVGSLPADIRWHFIGPLQTNKVRLVRPVVTLLHSMDRLRLGAVWMKGPGSPPAALLQVNVGGEEQKHGVSAGGAEDAAGELIRLGVPLGGLMTIPPADPERARGYFQDLRRVRDRLVGRWPECRALSMGMTDDFEVAVEEGATYIRVGRAIFGS